MAIRAGLAHQLGAKAETTYGTYAAVDHFYEDVACEFDVEDAEIESAGLRAGNMVLRDDDRKQNKTGVTGALNLEVASKGFGLWFLHMLGAVVISTPTGATDTRRHTHTLADLYGKSLTIQGGLPDVSGTVQPFSWLGCKVPEWELSQDLDSLLMLSLSVDGQAETTAQSLVSASYPEIELFDYQQCDVTLAGSPFHPTRFSLAGSSPMKTDRRFLRASPLKKEPILNALRTFTGNVDGEFESLTAYNRFVNKTVVSLVVVWTGSTIEGDFPFKITLSMPAVIFTGETPKASGPDVLPQMLPYKVLYNGTDEPITLTYDTTDTAS